MTLELLEQLRREPSPKVDLAIDLLDGVKRRMVAALVRDECCSTLTMGDLCLSCEAEQGENEEQDLPGALRVPLLEPDDTPISSPSP